MPEYDVFLSHNNADKEAVEIIAHRLREEAKLLPFLDEWHLIPGEPWQEAIEEALGQSETVAVFVGPSGISPWHNEEMRAGLDQAVRTRDDYRVIPVLLPGASEETLTGFLARRTWVDFRAGLDDVEAFERLVVGIKGEAIDVGEYGLPDEPTPYRGLLRFEAQHAEFFFGRETDVQHLLEKLGRQSFVAVIGASGGGKSSLVRAGLLPALADDALPGSREWRTLVLTPGGRPMRALAEGLATFVPPADRLRLADELVDRLAAQADGLRTAVTTLLADGQQRLLLVIDQFEEIFTLCQDGPERCRTQVEQFIANLADTVQRGDRRILMLITLRADFLDRCLAFSLLKDLLQDNQMLLGPLGEPALRDAIVRPAQAVGAYLEKGLVSTILRDVLAQPGSLPLLQHALYELWRARRGPWLTLEAYEASGGVSGALQRRAQATYDSLTPDQQSLARSVFLRLTALGEGVSDTRRRVARAELYPAELDPAQVDAVLQVLSSPQARLIVANEQVVEVAHEALIQQWPTLREWLEADRESLRTHRHLTEAAQEWVDLNRDAGELYRGARLAQCLEWAEEHAADLNPLEREFLTASEELMKKEEAEREAQRRRELRAAQKLAKAERSRAEEQARTAQRFRRLSIGLSLLLTVALISTGWAIWQTVQTGRQARIARSGDLAAHAQTALEQYPQRSLLLAVEALAVTMREKEPAVPIAENVLRQALTNSGGSVVGRHAIPYTAMTITSDGEWLVGGGGGGVVLRRLGPSSRISSAVSGQDSCDVVQLSVRDIDMALALSHVTAVAASTDGYWLFTSIRIPDVVFQWDLADLTSDCQRIADWNRIYAENAAREADLPPSLAGGQIPLLGLVPSPQSTVIEQQKRITEVVVSEDNRWLIVGNEDGTVQLLDLTTTDQNDQYSSLFLQGHYDSINVVAVGPDSRWLVTGSSDNTARIWDLAAPDPSANPIVVDAHQDEILDAAISSDGRWLITGSADNTARLLELSAPDIAAQSIALTGHDSDVTLVAISPNNAWLVTGSDDNTARLWDLTVPNPGAQSVVLSGHTDKLTSLAISSDNRWLVTGSQDATARLWDLTASDPSAVSIVLRGHERAVDFVTISPDSRWLVSSGSTTDRLWDLTVSEPGAALSSREDNLTLDELSDLACDTAGRNLTSEEWELYFPGQDYRETCE